MRSTKILRYSIYFLVPSHYLFYLKQMEVKHIETSKYNYWIMKYDITKSKLYEEIEKSLHKYVDTD